MRRVRFGLCVDRSTAISARVRLFRLFLLIPCWESQRLIPKRSAGPRATKIGVISRKALDHHRPNREESAPTEAVVGVLRRQGLQPDLPCCFCPIVTNMAEYATASGSAEMVTPKNRLAGGEAPLLCRQHGIPQGPARADARRSTGRSPQRVIGTTPLFVMQISYMAASSHQSSSVSASAGEREAPSPMFRPCGQAPPARRNR